jgi:type III pantothenate kinase
MLTGFFSSLEQHLDGGIIACSVPNLTGIWAKALQTVLGSRPLVVGPGLKTGLKTHFNDPAEIGPDRIADAVGARQLYGWPLIVVDLGTSTSFSVVDEEGSYIGGLIAPGLELSARALSKAAARLPVIEVTRPAAVIGKSTREAMQAGFILGEVARIDGLIEAVWDELGYETAVVVTGEDAAAIAELLAHQCAIEPDLTLKGLALLFALNRKKR